LKVAPTLRGDSIELVDYHPTSHAAPASASGCAHSDEYQGSARRFHPAADSQPLGFDIGVRESQEGLELEQLRPEGSRLRFWAEALRRRAYNASHGIVDPDSEKMKFSHSVQFNAVPDWSSNYIAYSNLKKL
jgi:phosphate transporter